MYTLPDLPYDYQALEPAISGDIMHFHHDFHHRAYVDKLNAALEKAPELQQLSLEGLLSDLDSVPESVRTAIRNNGGGHYNHSFFWHCLTPASPQEPSGQLKADLVAKYGSFQAFVDQFSEAATNLFGSGWTWLLSDLSILTTANQDTPISIGEPEPLLTLDVWEHAYYLDYKNKRPDYIKAWWNIVNWERAEELYARR